MEKKDSIVKRPSWMSIEIWNEWVTDNTYPSLRWNPEWNEMLDKELEIMGEGITRRERELCDLNESDVKKVLTEVKTFMEDAICPYCEEGLLVHTFDVVYEVNQYLHTCDNKECNKNIYLKEKYPLITQNRVLKRSEVIENGKM